MRLPKWPKITRPIMRYWIAGGWVFVWMMLVLVVILLEAGDRSISDWMSEVDLFSLETNRAKSEPVPGTDRAVSIEQQAGQDKSQNSPGFDSTDAYHRQFELWGGAQWLLHSN